MEPRLVDAIRFDVVLGAVNAVLDLRKNLAPEDFRRVGENLVEGRFQGIDAVVLRQRHKPPRAKPRRADLGIHVAGKVLGEARVPRDDAERRLVRLARLVELDRRNEHALHPAFGGMHRQAARNRTANVVVMAEDLAEADQPLAVEYRDGRAEVGNVSDPAA